MRGGWWLLGAVLGAVASVGAEVARDRPSSEAMREEARQLRARADAELAAATAACARRIQVDACRDEAHRRWLERIDEAQALEAAARRTPRTRS